MLVKFKKRVIIYRMKYMSEYEIMKVLDALDKEYLIQAKNSDRIVDKKFATKAHFVIGKIKREFESKFKNK